MRLRNSLPLTLAGTAVVVLVAASPAAAATSTTWVSPTDTSWSTAGSWSATIPATGDDVTFAGGIRSTYDLAGATSFSSFHFTNDHTVANGGGAIGLTAGLTVDPGAAVRIEPLVSTSGGQQWTVGSGATLTMPSQINVESTSTLTLQVDGTMAVTTGNLDGGGGACIVKTGSGLLSFGAGGGGVGTCAGQPAGLNVAAGEVAIVGTANLGGKNFAVTGGTLTGGTDSGAAVIRALNLASTGVVSPGPASGAGIGQIDLWGTSAWTDGTYQVDWDAAANAADYVFGAGQAIAVNGTRLDIRLAGTPAAGQSVWILGSDVAYTGQFASPAGTPLASGDEFTSNGQVYSIEYTSNAGTSGVVLHWLRAAPVVVAPPATTPAATLPATGTEPALPLGVAALLLGVGAVVVIAGGRRLRRR